MGIKWHLPPLAGQLAASRCARRVSAYSNKSLYQIKPLMVVHGARVAFLVPASSVALSCVRCSVTRGLDSLTTPQPPLEKNASGGRPPKTNQPLFVCLFVGLVVFFASFVFSLPLTQSPLAFFGS